MASETAIVPLGGSLSIKESSSGVYDVELIEAPSSLPKVVNGDDRKDFSISFGPIKVVGYVVPSSLEIGVEVYVFGIKVGSFYGNLREGVVVNINFLVEKGKLRFFLQGKDVMLEIKVSGVFDFDKTVKLLSL